MEPRASSGENNLRQPPLALEALAQQLLAYESSVHPRADELPTVARHIYDRLRVRLSVFLGDVGFDALWERALSMARRAVRSANEAPGEHAETLPPGLSVALAGRDAAEAQSVLVAAFASFFALLFSFIGEDISLRLIRQMWPDLRFDAADAPGERSKP